MCKLRSAVYRHNQRHRREVSQRYTPRSLPAHLDLDKFLTMPFAGDFYYCGLWTTVNKKHGIMAASVSIRKELWLKIGKDGEARHKKAKVKNDNFYAVFFVYNYPMPERTIEWSGCKVNAEPILDPQEAMRLAEQEVRACVESGKWARTDQKSWLTANYKVILGYTNGTGEEILLFSKRQRSYKKANALRTRLIVWLINHGKRLLHLLPDRTFLKVSPHVLSYNHKGMYRGSGDCSDLMRSIKEDGQMNPILISKKGKVIAGFRRYFCTLALGIDVFAQVTDEDALLASIRQNRRIECCIHE